MSAYRYRGDRRPASCGATYGDTAIRCTVTGPHADHEAPTGDGDGVWVWCAHTAGWIDRHGFMRCADCGALVGRTGVTDGEPTL